MGGHCRQPGAQIKTAPSFSPTAGAGIMSAELLYRFAARREEPRGLGNVDVRDEQSFFTVWLVAEQSPVGPHHRRSGRRPSARDINSSEITGVLCGATQDRLLMERV